MVEPYPTKDLRDHVRDVIVEGGAGAIPVAGSALGKFINAAIKPSFEKRQEAWFAALGDLLMQIEQRIGSLERLEGDEEFITALASATRVALGTHLEEKLEMLKAVLLRVAEAPDRDLEHVLYLRLIDELEPEHVEALRIYAEEEWVHADLVSLLGEGQIYEDVARLLHHHALIEDARVTSKGLAFLEYLRMV